jgi:hypothetical protein
MRNHSHGSDHAMCEVLSEFFAQETVFPGLSAFFSPLNQPRKYLCDPAVCTFRPFPDCDHSLTEDVSLSKRRR